MGHLNPEQWDAATASTIRAERAAAGLSQAKVSELSGIPRVSYIRYETGERKPNITQIAAIAQALNIPFSTFVRRIEDRVKSQ